MSPLGAARANPVYVSGVDLEGVIIPVSGNIEVDVIAIPPDVFSSQETVDAAGTAQAISVSVAILSGVTVKALHDNSGKVYVGDASVDSVTGFVLSAGEQIFIEVDNVSDVFIDADTNDDGVSWLGS